MEGMNPHTSPPLSPSVASATEALQLAEQVLEEALTLGGDTSDARAAVQVGHDALAAATAAEQQAADEAAAAERDAAEQDDADAVDAAEEEFTAVVSTVAAAPGAEALPAPVVPGMVLQSLRQVQRAQRALAAAQAPYAAAAKDVAAVRARLNAKETALAEIRARRTGGDEQPGDAAAMAALAMDGEDLRRIAGGLQAKVDAAASAVQAAQQAVREAQQAVVAAKARAELDSMVERVRAVETHFVAQVRALRLAAQARGHGNFGSVYLPSEKLRMLAAGGWI
jgi:colicin import membrane protein